MWPRQGPNARNNAYSVKKGSEALGLDCYVEGKDVVVPVDALIGKAEEAKLPAPSAPFACKRGPFKVLLFMGGFCVGCGAALSVHEDRSVMPAVAVAVVCRRSRATERRSQASGS